MTGRRLLAATLGAALFGAVPWACAVAAETPAAAGEVHLTPDQIKLIQLATAPATPGTVSPELVLNGEVKPDQVRVVEVLPRAAGIVREVQGQLGDAVKRGDTLAVIESSAIADAEATYLNAKSRAALAEIRAAREADLWRKRISAEQDYLAAKQAAAAAAVELQAAERKLALLGLDPKIVGRRVANVLVRVPVVAPIDGTLIERRVAAGDQVTDATPLFRLADLDKVWVIASVFEKDMGKVALGQTATVSLAGYPDRRFQGTVTWISDVVDEKTRTLKIRVELENRDRALRPGSFARVSITPRAAASGLVIPASAVQHQKNDDIVFVDIGSGNFLRREVTIGARTRDKAEVLRGLKPGEQVVTEGSFALLSELEKGAFADQD